MRFCKLLAVLPALTSLNAQYGIIAGNPFSTPADRTAGAQSFRSQCAACHGLDGSGTSAAPGLAGGVFKHGGSDEALFRVITKGVPGTAMTGFALHPRDVWQLITFLRYLNIGKAAEKATGNATKGAQVYNTNGCSRCHTIGATGGFSGPDLTGIASRRSLADLGSSLVAPNADVSPDYWSVKARTKSGQTVTGIRMNEDMTSFQVLESSGRLRSLLKSELATFEIVSASPMPSFKDKLQAKELEDLIAYLASLRGVESK